VEDENAERVYVPGTNSTPPARDVEPFWPPEELAAPVHGGRPVPHDAPPARPVPGPDEVHRPVQRAVVPPPAAPRLTAPRSVARPVAPSVSPVDPPTQAWPNITPRSAPPAPGPAPVVVEPPAATEGPAADSPWAQPPQRPAPNGTTADGPDARRAAYYPTVTPRRSPENAGPADPDAGGTQPEIGAGQGPVYRPEPRPTASAAPAAPPHVPAPAPRSAPPAAPPHALPPAPAPRPAPPGPYPPRMDHRPAAPRPGPNPGPPPADDPYQQVPWVSDGTPTAEEFARRRLARPAEPVATMGARALVPKATMGLVRLAPGKYEREYKQDVEMVRRNFGGLRQVTVVNPKGGAGKTVAVLLLAMTFGQKRGGYVLAWDNNETQGTLGMRAQQDFHARFRGAHGRVGDLSQYVRAQGEGMFDVLASDESATAGEMLTASAFAEIREIVSRFYKLIFVDTGNNVRAQNWQAAMDATDQLVITMSARNDSAETAARMLDHLEQSGRQRLVRQAISVVTMPTTRKDIDLPAIQRHFAARTRAVLLAPYEKLIDSGEPIRYGQLSNSTKDAWLKIAAAVAEGL
jgi:MinD-like ATPase involved in chromosome partitioning or flagellar assembly